jgi:hypothetical protein
MVRGTLARRGAMCQVEIDTVAGGTTTLNPGSSTTFVWSLYQSQKNVVEFLIILLAIASLPAMIYILLWAVSLPSDLAALILASAGFGLWVVFFLLTTLRTLHGATPDRSEAKFAKYGGAVLSIGFVAYYLTLPFFDLLPEGQSDSLSRQWLLFLFDQVLGGISFGLYDASRFQLSEITPATGIARLGVLFLRTLIVVGTIQYGIELYRLAFGRRRFYDTVEGCYWLCSTIPGIEDMELRIEGAVIQRPPVVVSADKFLGALKHHYKSRTVEPIPVVHLLSSVFDHLLLCRWPPTLSGRVAHFGYWLFLGFLLLFALALLTTLAASESPAVSIQELGAGFGFLIAIMVAFRVWVHKAK